MDRVSRRLPVGAEVQADGGVHFRVWAPASSKVSVLLGAGTSASAFWKEVALEEEGAGYFSGFSGQAQAGTRYKFRLDSGDYPDPASRFQPEGPEGWSQVVDPSSALWTDQAWRGLPPAGQVVYEMHIGTFTREGTYKAAGEQLADLASLGITTIELMPLADFPGRFGWGYDGVNLFAPCRLYGEPDSLRRFIDRAHHLGIGVILDVVYNHFGPDCNFLDRFSSDYQLEGRSTEWGDPINFDGRNSGPVREFYLANAGYWIDEFHFDGLRLDATQVIVDGSPEHIVSAIARRVREVAGNRSTWVVAENEGQRAQLIRSRESGGYGIDALWNDDFHHSARVRLTGRKEAYYTDYRGTPQEFISAAKRGFLFQGQWYSWQKKARGTAALDVHPSQFVHYIQNHDQVANSLDGRRVHELASAGELRAMTTLLLLTPQTPMLFQGQEFAASAPFLYFADHGPELAKKVALGRRDFLRQFASIRAGGSEGTLDSPSALETFEKCKLDFGERQTHAGVLALHHDLLKLRREDSVFSRSTGPRIDGGVLGEEAFVLRFFGEDGDERLLLVNFGLDLGLAPMPEPLLAPPEQRRWVVVWNSEAPIYGGSGLRPMQLEEGWMLTGRAAVVLAARGI